MPGRPPESHHSSLNLKDVLFALFKHKWKIALCAIAGLIAAAAVYFLYPPIYASQAKLLVRYVLERSVDSIDSSAGRSSGVGKTTDTVIGSEVEILTSWDLAVQVADALGAKRLSPASGASATKGVAAGTVRGGLEVTARKGSDVIFISYKNRDPELATLVLNELVNRYFIKHLEVHRSAGAFDFVTQQTDQVRARLNQTEDALRALRAKFGISSLAESTAALNTELSKTTEQLHAAEAELAEQRGRLNQMEGAPPVDGQAATNTNPGKHRESCGTEARTARTYRRDPAGNQCRSSAIPSVGHAFG